MRSLKSSTRFAPHEALGQETPASHYQSSPRPYPQELPEPDYPSHFHHVFTYPNGVISFRTTQWYISGCLKNELGGIEEVDDGRFKVWFGPVSLGILDLRNNARRGNRQFGFLVRSDGPTAQRPRAADARDVEARGARSLPTKCYRCTRSKMFTINPVAQRHAAKEFTVAPPRFSICLLVS